VLTSTAHPLPPEEMAKIRRHAAISREILEKIRFLDGYEDIPVMAGQHHEKLSGKGYPRGDAGDQITLGGRLLAVADIYDALRQRRRYKPPKSVEEALAILHSDTARGDLDPKAVALLEKCLEEIERVCGPLRPGWDEEIGGPQGPGRPGEHGGGKPT
jgi:HD-GYP domain-containing protein (c-di-GMP phosphodiesterase class II)